jgi:hypothetical protein
MIRLTYARELRVDRVLRARDPHHRAVPSRPPEQVAELRQGATREQLRTVQPHLDALPRGNPLRALVPGDRRPCRVSIGGHGLDL